MAISENTKKKRSASSALYKADSSVSDALLNLASIKNRSPYYENSYADELKSIYQRIKDAPEFEYSSDNDAAYRSFADEYKALAALAVAGNQAQAQDLSGGYSSSYAGDVAAQNLQALNDSAENAKPEFLMNAEQAYAANNDLLKNMYQAAAGAGESELEDFSNLANAYNNALKAARTQYADSRDFDYSKYSENRDFWDKQYENELDNENKQKQLELKKYDVYKQLAADKCSEYNEKKNNKGMKSYLDSLVKEGKLTSYLAQQLYQKYKYTAPSGRSRSGGSRSGGTGSGRQKKYVANDNWQPDEKILQFVNMNNRAGSFNTAVYWIERLIKEKKLDKSEKLNYVYYFRNMLG